MKFERLKHLALAGTLLSLGGVAQATLILNGDFESGATSWALTGNVHVVGPSGPPLWFGGGTAAQNGTRVATFNAGDTTPNGAYAQTFNTLLDEIYDVQFDFGATGLFSSDTQKMIFSVLGNDGINVLLSQEVTGTNPPVALATFNFSFTADGAQATLRFADLVTNATNSQDGILDNVSVNGPSAEVPEPASLALVSLCLAGIGLGRRKQQLSRVLRAVS